MGANSKISWTHHTFNPWWGCTRVSPGCEHCYAETFAKRTRLGWGPRAERRFFGAKHWNAPLKWNREAEAAGERRRVFCASMADVFEDNLSLVTERIRLWELIEATPWLDWLLLTKRPENADGMTPTAWRLRGWPAHVWAMTTAEDQRRADERIPHLLRIPAKVRGLSVEPMLGPVDLTAEVCLGCGKRGCDSCPCGTGTVFRYGQTRNEKPYWPISWVITGGESGHGARPMHPEWARSLRNQCRTAGAAFHHKQWGEWADYAQLPSVSGWEFVQERNGKRYGRLTHDDEVNDGFAFDGRLFETRYPWNTPENPGPCMVRVGKSRAGRLLDGREWNEFPEVSAHA